MVNRDDPGYKVGQFIGRWIIGPLLTALVVVGLLWCIGTVASAIPAW